MTDQERTERKSNRTLGTMALLARLQAEAPAALKAARVVGRWVWLEFDRKPDDKTRLTIKSLGFHWNKKREAWQHPCGWFCKASPRDPRNKYGTTNAVDLLNGRGGA